MHGPKFFDPLYQLVGADRMSVTRIDDAVRPILLAKFRLGLFENAQVEPSIAKSVMFNEEHQQTALELARQGIVLLKNDSNTLPLATGTRVFVTGPNANNHSLLGDWVFQQPEENITTVVEGLRKVGSGLVEIDYFDLQGTVKNIQPNKIATAAKKAESADVAIVVVGSNPLRYERKEKTSGENVARSSIGLIGQQLALVKAIHATGVPTIVVLINGRPLAEPWIVDNVSALVEAWEPGALGGIALAEILFGHVNPSGKMPITVPYSAGHLKAFYNHKPTAKVRKYADAPSRNLYEFGDGLSYTDFAYTDVKLSSSNISVGESTTLSVVVSNVGQRSGDEVVQLYIRDNFSAVTRPVKELKGFQRVSLKPGEARRVRFDITPAALGYFGIDMTWQVEPGDFTIMVGGSSRQAELETVILQVRS